MKKAANNAMRNSFSTLDSENSNNDKDNDKIEIKHDISENENENSMASVREVYLSDKNIDVKRNRYPYCIVWTPLPIISYLIPIIGHTGICK